MTTLLKNITRDQVLAILAICLVIGSFAGALVYAVANADPSELPR